MLLLLRLLLLLLSPMLLLLVPLLPLLLPRLPLLPLLPLLLLPLLLNILLIEPDVHAIRPRVRLQGLEDLLGAEQRVGQQRDPRLQDHLLWRAARRLCGAF